MKQHRRRSWLKMKSVILRRTNQAIQSIALMEVDNNILVVETENNEIGSIDETSVSTDKEIKTEESIIIIKDDTDDESKEDLHVSDSETINLISKSNSVSNLGNSEPVESENTVDEKVRHRFWLKMKPVILRRTNQVLSNQSL